MLTFLRATRNKAVNLASQLPMDGQAQIGAHPTVTVIQFLVARVTFKIELLRD